MDSKKTKQMRHKVSGVITNYTDAMAKCPDWIIEGRTAPAPVSVPVKRTRKKRAIAVEPDETLTDA